MIRERGEGKREKKSRFNRAFLGKKEGGGGGAIFFDGGEK